VFSGVCLLQPVSSQRQVTNSLDRVLWVCESDARDPLDCLAFMLTFHLRAPSGAFYITVCAG